MRNAPSTGEPSNVLTAAKLPAEARIVTAIGAASFLARRTASAPNPAPIAINGASGPRTAPRLSAAIAARAMPGRSRPTGAPPPAWNPKAGEWPPFPGRWRMARAVSRPDNSSHGTGHQAGAAAPKIWVGSSEKTYPWIAATRARKPYATVEIGTPASAARTKPATYGFERITVTGSTTDRPSAVPAFPA
jgi:hypothetical protein